MTVYRYIATTLEGLVQQVSVSYVGHGYVHYVAGWVPEGKDPRRVDEKLIDKYEIAISKWARARRKRQGRANLHYIRLERFFLVLATPGVHTFFEEEATRVRDCRRNVIPIGGYQVSSRRGHDRRWHPHVAIADEEYRYLKAYLLDLAVHRSAESLAQALWNVPFEPYAGVRRQMFTLLRLVNRARKRAGLDLVPKGCIRLRRRSVKPFEEPRTGGNAGDVNGGRAEEASGRKVA